MRKKLLSITAIALTSGLLVFTGCSKDDTTAPEVTLNGAETVTISLNSNSYTELGATATDDKDGSVTVTTSGNVNKDLTGTYTITYSATDAAGNEGTAIRTVIVRNDAYIYEGLYNAYNPLYTTPNWEQTVKASTTTNNAIVFSKFAGRTGNDKVEAKLLGTNAFELVDKTVPDLGASKCTFKYTRNGSGATVSKPLGKYTFSIKYFEEKIAGAVGVCDAISPTPFEDVFTQK